MKLPGWAREPILHFLLIGLILFLASHWLGEETQDDQTINVSQSSLARFMQYRQKNFDDDAIERLEKLSPAAIKLLVKEYVREEALYRTARKYQLDKDDYVIQRRLVQKMEFLGEGAGDLSGEPEEEVLEDFYNEQQHEYMLPARITFTHVFLDKVRAEKNLEQHAIKMLHALNEQGVTPHEATALGDRFPYQQNLAEREADEVAGFFGQTAADKLFAMNVDSQLWQGPVYSSLGAHLILKLKHEAERQPGFSEVREQVVSDFLHAERSRQQMAFVEKLIQDYSVVYADDFADLLSQDQ